MDVEKREALCTTDRIVFGKATMKNCMKYIQIFKMKLPYDPVIIFQLIYPKKTQRLT